MGVDEQLQITVRRDADRVVVMLDGELDMASAPLLQSTLEGAALATDTTMVLDLQALQFIDSTGLRAILSLRVRSAVRCNARLAAGPASVGHNGRLRAPADADRLSACLAQVRTAPANTGG
jgi:anti-anti-sigma factor